LDSVVLTDARPRPVALATSPAVIDSEPESASRTARLVAPDALRPRREDDAALRRVLVAVAPLVRVRRVPVARAPLEVAPRADVDVERREPRRAPPPRADDARPSPDPKAASACRSLSVSA
jgi:hypothetical protein